MTDLVTLITGPFKTMIIVAGAFFAAMVAVTGIAAAEYMRKK